MSMPSLPPSWTTAFSRRWHSGSEPKAVTQSKLQFATALEERLVSLVESDELEKLRKEGEAELQEPGRWGTTFTLLQCWGRV